MLQQKKLDLTEAEPILGLEKERDGSFSASALLSNVRIGLFFEPANSFCNDSNKLRVKLWYVADNAMEYIHPDNIKGLRVFLKKVVLLSNEKDTKDFRQEFIMKA